LTLNRLNRKKWLILAVKLLIVVLLVWFIRGTLVKAWGQIQQHQAESPTWQLDLRWLALAGGLYLLGLLPAGLFWYRSLRVLGQDAKLGESLRAYYISHLGKYVPGKAMVVVVRAGLVRSQRVHAGVAAAAVFYETLTMMAVGAAIGAAFCAIRAREEGSMFWFSIALGLMLVTGLPTLPPIFTRLARLAGVGKSDPTTAANLQRIGYGTLLLGWMLMALLWVFLGLSLWATLRGMGLSQLGPWEHLFSYTGSISLAVVAGFLSLIPGGLGVRDVVLLMLVRLFHIAEAEAVIAAGLVRLVWLLSEVLISVILYLGGLCMNLARRFAAGPVDARTADEGSASK
jgi:glycosyltransferase 2 family protein